MLRDRRSGKIALVAHCILNQNSRACGLAEKSSVITEIVEFLVHNDLGIVQMPCPELAYAGVSRTPQTREQYDTATFRKHCKKFAEELATQVQEYEKSGIRLKIVLGIDRSPSCGVNETLNMKTSGIFMEELHSALAKRKITVPFYAIGSGHLSQDLINLKKLIRD